MARNIIEFVLTAKDKASKKVGGLKGKLAGLKSGLSALVGPAGMVAAGIAAVGAATLAIASKTAKWGDELAKTEKRLGVTTEQLSTLAFAAERSGSSYQSITKGMQTLARNANDANEGLKSQSDSFQQLGVDVADSSGNLKSMDVLLRESADKFAVMNNDTEAAALALKVFGRAGLDMLPMLKEGSAGIEALQQRARDLGLEMSGEAAANAEAYEDAMTDFRSVIKGVTQSIGTALIPVMTKMINWFVDGLPKVKAFFTGAKSAYWTFADSVTDFYAKVIGGVAVFVDKYLGIWQKVAEGIDWVSEKVTGKSLDIGGRLESIRETVSNVTDSVTENLQKFGEATVYVADNDVVPAHDRMSESVTRLGESADAAYKKTIDAVRPAVPEFVGLDSALNDQAGRMERLKDRADNLGFSIEGLGEDEARALIRAEELTEGLDEQVGATNRLKSASREAGASGVRALAGDFDLMSMRINTANSELNDFINGLLDLCGIKIPDFNLSKSLGIGGTGGDILNLGASYGLGKGKEWGMGKLGWGKAGSWAKTGVSKGASALNAAASYALPAAAVAGMVYLNERGQAATHAESKEQARLEMLRKGRLAAESARRHGFTRPEGGYSQQMSADEMALMYGDGTPARPNDAIRPVEVHITNNGPLMGNEADAIRFGRQVYKTLDDIDAGRIT